MIIIFFWDLNSRLNLNYFNELIKNLINKDSKTLNGDYKDILIYDQFKQYQKESSLILKIEESTKKFSDTYIYNIGISENDTNKKRLSSWSGRIIYKKL